MTMSRRTRIRLCVAIAAGISSSIVRVELTHAQQSPTDPTVFLNANDSTGSSSFFGGATYQWGASSNGVLPLGSAPTSGYAYVVTGSATGTGQLRSPVNGSVPVTFAGDSLTIIPFNGQANLYNTSTGIVNAQDKTAGLFLYGTTAGQTVTVPNLVLANGGAVLDASSIVTNLNGAIDLLPSGTVLDGITTTVSGGIIDEDSSNSTTVLAINAAISGSGQLHIIATQTIIGAVALNGSNGSFSGGVLLDNTIGTGAVTGSNQYPLLAINSPTALGTGNFTVGSNNPSGVMSAGSSGGPQIDNTTGTALTLTTNPTMLWNGNFQFKGSSSLYTGGAVTLGANVTLTIPHSVLGVSSVSGPYTLSLVSGSVGAAALEVPTLSAITSSGFSIGSGATLALPASTTSNAQFVAAASNSLYASTGALLGIDTTGVTGGIYNMSASLPSGSYGINKLGAGTLLLSGTANSYTGFTIISNGTLMLGSANALGSTPYVNLGSSGNPAASTLDLNGFSTTIDTPNGGAGVSGTNSQGLITNSSATPAVLTLQQTTAFVGNSSYFGNISGNLSIVVAYPTPSTTSYSPEYFGGTNTYTGTTNLSSGVLETGSAALQPNQQVLFKGGTLYATSDVSGSFNQSPGQLYNILASGTVSFATGLTSAGGSLTLGNILYGPAGTLNLTATNTYSGATSVNAGYLEVSNPRALAGTSSVTVNGLYANPNVAGASNYFSDLMVNDNSGLAGLNSSGQAINLYLGGIGAGNSTITYKRGVTTYTAGSAFYGALQGTAGGTDTWAGNIILVNQTPAFTSVAPVGISGGFNNASTGGILNLTGKISGTGPLVLGLNSNSTTVLAASNSYSGETLINCSTGKATTVQLGANFGVPAGSGLDFSYNPAYTLLPTTYIYGTETFDLNGYNTSTAFITSDYSVNGTNFTNATALITNSKAASTSILTVSLAGSTSTFAGTINNGSGLLGLTINNSGQLQLAGVSNYGGTTTVDQTTLQAGSTTAFSPGSTYNLSGYSASVLDLNNFSSAIGSLSGAAGSSVLASATLTVGSNNTSNAYAGTISGAGGLVKVGSGVETFAGTNTYTGGTNISSGTLGFSSAGALPDFSSLTIGTGAAGAAARHATGLTGAAKNNLFVSSLAIAGSTNNWTGTLDLANNDMVVQNGNLAQITNMVEEGYNGGAWNGPGGILSTAAAADSKHLTALGVILNSNNGSSSGSVMYTSFDGAAASANTDVLVKFTYYGDTDLNGEIDGTDYSRIDNAYQNNLTAASNAQLTGWYNGDFNYDGVINASDYTLMDNAFNTQGAQPLAQAATATAQIAGGSAMPEPTAIALLGIAAFGLLGRRRK